LSKKNRIPPPVVSLRYSKPWGKDPAQSIYLFDREAAKAGFAYFAENEAASSRWFAFTIRVNERHRDAVREIIDRLNPRRQPTKAARFAGWWMTIEPTRLTKTHKDHRWLFAVYRESSYQRDDGLNYTAFLFRDVGRTTFGIREWLGDERIGTVVLEKLAYRVVTDTAFRNSLVSDDPDLPLLWKKR
jgi:hypothetical protein